MNFTAVAIRRLRMEIPDEILEMAFNGNQGYSFAYTNRSVDSFIEKTLLKELFIEDISPYLGPTVPITIHPSWIAITADARTLIRVPLSITNNRRIVSALELYHGPADAPIASGYSTMTAPYGFSNGTNANSQVLASSAAVMNTQLGSIAVGTNNLEIVDINAILYHGMNRIIAPASLLVKLELDPELRGITIQYHALIADVFTEFVKAKIWQKLIVKIDKSAINAGQSIGSISTIVDQYADAIKNYREMLTTLVVKLGSLANPRSKRNFARNMIGIH
jgi:hypothetical protein